MPCSVKAVVRMCSVGEETQVELETCGQLANVSAADVTGEPGLLSSPGSRISLLLGGNPDSRDKSRVHPHTPHKTQ